MYQTKGSIGARIGACLLDGAILWVMSAADSQKGQKGRLPGRYK